MNELTGGIFHCGIAGSGRAVGSLVISLHIRIRNEATRISVGRVSFINVDDGTVFLEAHQLP